MRCMLNSPRPTGAAGPRIPSSRASSPGRCTSRLSGTSAGPSAGLSGRHLTLVHQVQRECVAQGIHTAPQLALEATRLLQVNPDNLRPGTTVGDRGERRLVLPLERPERPERHGAALRAACVRFLVNRGAPGLVATRMRIAFRRKYRTPSQIASEQARSLESRLAPLLAEILDEGCVSLAPGPPRVPRAPRKDNGTNSLYGSVVAAAVLRSGLGSPADPDVIKEANAAMQSVYPARELPQLLRLPASERHAQLLEVCRIAAGVRIFNWDSRQAGEGREGLLDLPGLVLEAASVTAGLLQDAVQSVESRLWPATAALQVMCDAGNGVLDLSAEDLDLLKETVVYLRQQQVLLRCLLEDVEGAGEEARRLTSLLRTELQEVNAVVQAKTTVPSNEVYPQFMSLACTWEELETQAVVISRATSLHRRLEAYAQSARTLEHAAVVAVLGDDKTSPTDADRVSTVSVRGEQQQQLAAMRRRLAKDLERGAVVTELEGFCPWFLVVSRGGLLPGCPAIGLCEANDGRLYALSSLDAAQAFEADPNRWIREARNEIRRRPAMVGLLGLSDSLLKDSKALLRSRVAGDGLGTGLRPSLRANRTSHAAVQTDARAGGGLVLAPSSSSSCRRSRAQLSRTPSTQFAGTQTEASSYRRACESQTFPPRDAAVQCPRTVSCTAGTPRTASRSLGAVDVDSATQAQFYPLRYALDKTVDTAVSAVSKG